MINFNNKQVQIDLKEIATHDIPWEKFANSTVLITGATGMLASYFGFTLLYLNKTKQLNCKLVLLARSKEKLQIVYGDELAGIDCLVQDVCAPIQNDKKVDYIFHAAGNASPYYIINDPVGIISANVQGTENILKFAQKNKPKNIVFASTREIYGKIVDKTFIEECDMGVLDPLDPRNSYPESKRLAEALFVAYSNQYDIPFNTLRIAHSYGPGMQLDGDGRVMSDFLADAVNERDIVLKSTGEAERAFCYISDAVSAIFKVLLEGENREAYNVANEKEPIRLIDLANLIQNIVGKNKSVKIEIENNKAAYTSYKRVALSTKKIETLGWESKVKLRDGIKRTLISFGVEQ